MVSHDSRIATLRGRAAITPLQASGKTAFYSATAILIVWLHWLPHASEWVDGQNIADHNTWTGLTLHSLKHLHDQLMHHYNCKEWAPPPNSIAVSAPGEPAPELDDNARPLSLPPLNLIASFRVWQDEENGNADVRPSLPPHRRVTKHIMSSCKSGAATKLLSAILLPKACVMYTSCISLNLSVRLGALGLQAIAIHAQLYNNF